jgi:hypothetical protein
VHPRTRHWLQLQLLHLRALYVQRLPPKRRTPAHLHDRRWPHRLPRVAIKTALLTTIKIVWNPAVSTPRAKYMTADVKDFYLGAPMGRYEYMSIPISLIPDQMIALYHIYRHLTPPKPRNISLIPDQMIALYHLHHHLTPPKPRSL